MDLEDNDDSPISTLNKTLSMAPTVVGAILNSHLDYRGWNIDKLSVESKVDAPTIERLIAGKPVSAAHLAAIADALDIKYRSLQLVAPKESRTFPVLEQPAQPVIEDAVVGPVELRLFPPLEQSEANLSSGTMTNVNVSRNPIGAYRPTRSQLAGSIVISAAGIMYIFAARASNVIWLAVSALSAAVGCVMVTTFTAPKARKDHPAFSPLPKPSVSFSNETEPAPGANKPVRAQRETDSAGYRRWRIAAYLFAVGAAAASCAFLLSQHMSFGTRIVSAAGIALVESLPVLALVAVPIFGLLMRRNEINCRQLAASSATFIAVVALVLTGTAAFASQSTLGVRNYVAVGELAVCCVLFASSAGLFQLAIIAISDLFTSLVPAIFSFISCVDVVAIAVRVTHNSPITTQHAVIFIGVCLTCAVVPFAVMSAPYLFGRFIPTREHLAILNYCGLRFSSEDAIRSLSSDTKIASASDVRKLLNDLFIHRFVFHEHIGATIIYRTRPTALLCLVIKYRFSAIKDVANNLNATQPSLIRMALNLTLRSVARTLPVGELRHYAQLYAIKHSRGKFLWRDTFENNLLIELPSYIDGAVFVSGSFDVCNINYVRTAIVRHKCDTFIDVGAYNGEFSLTMASLPQIHTVHAYEPEPNNFDNLRGNLLLNETEHTRKIRTIDKALGAVYEHKPFYPSTHTDKGDAGVINKGTASFIFDSNRHTKEISIIAEVVRGDDELKLNGHKIAIKIDAARSELDVLTGMPMLLRRNSCVVVVELLSDENVEFAEQFFTKLKYSRIEAILDPNNYCFTNFMDEEIAGETKSGAI